MQVYKAHVHIVHIYRILHVSLFSINFCEKN